MKKYKGGSGLPKDTIMLDVSDVRSGKHNTGKQIIPPFVMLGLSDKGAPTTHCLGQVMGQELYVITGDNAIQSSYKTKPTFTYC
ncbi:MAG TPA: hypothetical protein ENN30_00095 [Candidatus Woesearchaeota archaeon]|nr:hypothetical protein [Candidatus Woesearchaeota archaeon]